MKHKQQLRYLPVLIALSIITGLLLVACGGDQKTYTVGVINVVPVLDRTLEGFKEGMAESGYIEGKNITYIYEGATADIPKLEAVAQNLVAAKVDLILSITTPATQAAQKATTNTNIPVVFVPLTDPVGAGIVDSLRNPGGNITGITFGVQEGQRLKWLIQVAPAIKNVYIIYNPDDQSPVLALKTLSETAPRLGLKLITRQAHNQEEVTTAIENIPKEADAVFILPDSLVATRVSDLVEAATKLRLPTSGANVEDVEARGVLTAYSVGLISSGKQAARLADQILRGIKPADLPVEMAEFFAAINLKTANAIGLTIPDEVLEQADIINR